MRLVGNSSVLGLGLALALAFVVVPAAAQSDAGAARQGDRWTYEVRDEITGDLKRTFTKTVVETTANEIVTRITTRGDNRHRTVVFTHDWARIDDDVWKFSPHDGMKLSPSLRVGQQWRTDRASRNMHTGAVFNTSGVAKVVGEETIANQSGTHRVLRIEAAERQILGADANKTTEGKVTLWYAPEIDHWVRRKVELRAEGRLRDSYTEELIEFSRKPGEVANGRNSDVGHNQSPAHRADSRFATDNTADTPREPYHRLGRNRSANEFGQRSGLGKTRD